MKHTTLRMLCDGNDVQTDDELPATLVISHSPPVARMLATFAPFRKCDAGFVSSWTFFTAVRCARLRCARHMWRCETETWLYLIHLASALGKLRFMHADKWVVDSQFASDYES